MQLRNESPGLARALCYGAPPVGARYSPTRWPWPLHLVLGLTFFAVGSYLDVTSATFLGLALTLAAAARWIATRGTDETPRVAAQQWGPGLTPPTPRPGDPPRS